MNLIVKKLSDNAHIPTIQTSGSAGYDLYSSIDGNIAENSRGLVSTDIIVKIPKNHCGLIWPRSGYSVKNGIETGAGVIDSDYEGEIKVLLHNHGNRNFEYTVGMRIAQLLIVPIATPNIIEVNEIIPESDPNSRGTGGFGSTGM